MATAETVHHPQPHGKSLFNILLTLSANPHLQYCVYNLFNLLRNLPQLYLHLLIMVSDRPGRRRPFSAWMKKLASLKGSSSSDGNQPSGSKRNTYHGKSNSKKNTAMKNNTPYMAGVQGHGSSGTPVNGNRSFSTVPTGRTASTASMSHSRGSFHSSIDGIPPTIGGRSVTHTVSTEADVAHSDAAQSHGASSGAGTLGTAGGAQSTTRGADSTFSSPAPSLRSLTTTLTTIHSTAAPGTAANSHNGGAGSNANNTQSIQFSHQFPTSPPPTALPAHLVPQGSGGHPATYSTATANNLLTDNASILTLASSSKRRRRRSMDTDASVRALAPSSLFGGSRESLPLSVLSSNIDPNNAAATPAIHQARASVGGPGERASLYSATGVAPALPSERNSFYAGKQNIVGDGGSVKSGLLGHGRNDSISGSIAGLAAPSSPLASPREAAAPSVGRLSRTNSAWGESGEAAGDSETIDEEHAKV